MTRHVLELGSYVSVAYAGMILAEQGLDVVKWLGAGPDPILGLNDGEALWDWINHGKRLVHARAELVARLEPEPDLIVLDNIRASTWRRWKVDPAAEAARLGATWVSMRADDDGRSFDAIAQARAWGDHVGVIPVYIGDTAAGLWMAFKALAAGPGHHVLRQAACLAKLVEGELVAAPHRDGWMTPWDEPGSYGVVDNRAVIVFRGIRFTEDMRDDDWRRKHLAHRDGRYVI